MQKRDITSRKTTLSDIDDTFDKAHWQSLSPEERIEVVCDLSEMAWRMKGEFPGPEGFPRSTARILRS
ncbi:MAG TPA: hypothetical protein VLU25_02060 [Acidobacteriota bacterium]|nr:hypothetical protein [Acidobacteriota bacterium]